MLTSRSQKTEWVKPNSHDIINQITRIDGGLGTLYTSHYKIGYSIHAIVKNGRPQAYCVFQCDVPHQLIAQRQVGPVSVYCDGLGCHVLCLRHGISVWQHIGQSTTATSRHRRDMTSDVSKRSSNPNKQTNYFLNDLEWYQVKAKFSTEYIRQW